MYNHAPEGYICPFCLLVNGVENEHVHSKQSDIFYKDDYITAFISAGRYKNNKGNVIIIPNSHYENIYDLPNELSDKIHHLEKEVALALKEVYKCDGVSIVLLSAVITNTLIGFLVASESYRHAFYKLLISLPAGIVTFFIYRQTNFIYFWLNKIVPGYGNLSAGGGFALLFYMMFYLLSFLIAMIISFSITSQRANKASSQL